MSDSSGQWVEMVQALPNIHLSDEANAGSYSYKYASLPSILETIKPILTDHGWAVTQNVTNSDGGQPQVSTLFDHRDGAQRIYGPLTVPVSGAGAQAVGSAITYARRYAIVAALGLAPDDDDGKAATQQPRRVQPQTPHDRAWETVYNMATDLGKDPHQIWWSALTDAGVPAKTAGDMGHDQAATVIAAARKECTS